MNRTRRRPRGDQRGLELGKATSFLAFYGWYTQGGNPYASLLRIVRQKSGSLAAILADVQSITAPDQLRQLAAEPAADLRWQ